jgi:hypothetical protein
MLRRRIPTMRAECLETLRVCSTLLRCAVEVGLTAFDIGKMMERPFCRSVRVLRVRVETMGSQKCGIVGKSQAVLMMINPMIFTRTRRRSPGVDQGAVPGQQLACTAIEID